MKKYIFLIVLMIFLFWGLSNFNFIYATSDSNLTQKQYEITEKIDKINSEINNIEKEKTSVIEDVEKLNLSISNYEEDINELTEKINLLNTEIEIKQSAMFEEEIKYQEQKKLLEKRLVALYEAGPTSYLELLLDSKNLSDFISQYYLVSILVEADEEILSKISDTKNKIESEKKIIEESKEELDISKNKLEDNKKLLDEDKNKKEKLINNLSKEEKELQLQLEEMEEDRKKIAKELSNITTNVVKEIEPSESGYINPIRGKTKSDITTDYHGYKALKGKHTGIDFACKAETPILAVKDGIVVISTAAKNSNGTYRSYGEYIAIDHYDGTVTLYAHMLANSRQVKVGDKVSQGEIIGKVGSTGNSTGNHLHFEVRINNGKKCVDPKLYLK